MNNIYNHLIEQVCVYYNITLDEFFAEGRQSHRIKARAMVCQIIYLDGDWSSTRIAKLLKKKSHATILCAFRRHHELMTVDRNYKKIFYQLSLNNSKQKTINIIAYYEEELRKQKELLKTFK